MKSNLHTEEERILKEFENKFTETIQSGMFMGSKVWKSSDPETALKFLCSALASYRQVMREEVEKARKEPKWDAFKYIEAAKKSGGAPFDRGVDFGHNAALDKVATLLQDKKEECCKKCRLPSLCADPKCTCHQLTN